MIGEKMGQYFKILNLTKHEVIEPRDCDCGIKLWEMCANNHLGGILLFLLRQSSEGGGGDIQSDFSFDFSFAGRWAGDNIAVVGDYDDSNLYSLSESWKNISKEVKKQYDEFMRG